MQVGHWERQFDLLEIAREDQLWQIEQVTKIQDLRLVEHNLESQPVNIEAKEQDKSPLSWDIETDWPIELIQEEGLIKPTKHRTAVNVNLEVEEGQCQEDLSVE